MSEKHIGSSLVESLNDADALLFKAIEFYGALNWKSAIKNLSDAHKIFLAYKDIKKVSVCLSLTGLNKYLSKDEGYYKSLLLLEDSKFLSESTNDKLAIAVNKFHRTQIY